MAIISPNAPRLKRSNFCFRIGDERVMTPYLGQQISLLDYEGTVGNYDNID